MGHICKEVCTLFDTLPSSNGVSTRSFFTQTKRNELQEVQKFGNLISAIPKANDPVKFSTKLNRLQVLDH